MTYTVKASGLTKSYGGQRVLDQVDLEVECGTVFALLGPNGAGKTTMVRILATLVRPDAGMATVAGHDLLADPLGVKRSISLTGQFAAIDDLLTGEENLEMMGQLRHLSRKAARSRAAELLVAFDLTEARHRRAATYSGGMKRRLDLAISMIEKPRLLFLDEPTTGLDPRSRDQLWSAVRQLRGDGVTILLTTQYLEEADQLADEIALLNEGRIVAQGSADALKESFGGGFLRLEFADDAGFARAAGSLLCLRKDGERGLVDIATDGSASDVYDTLALLRRIGTPADKVSIHRPSLDDVFLSLTSTNQRQTESKEIA